MIKNDHNKFHIKARLILSGALWVFLACGCGNRLHPVSLEGAVVFRDQPVPSGHITFIAEDRTILHNVRTTCEIRDGQYSCPQKRGVIGGQSYRVEIGGFQRPADVESDEAPPLFELWTTTTLIPEQGGSLDFDIVKLKR